MSVFWFFGRLLEWSVAALLALFFTYAAVVCSEALVRKVREWLRGYGA